MTTISRQATLLEIVLHPSEKGLLHERIIGKHLKFENTYS